MLEIPEEEKGKCGVLHLWVNVDPGAHTSPGPYEAGREQFQEMVNGLISSCDAEGVKHGDPAKEAVEGKPKPRKKPEE